MILEIATAAVGRAENHYHVDADEGFYGEVQVPSMPEREDGPPYLNISVTREVFDTEDEAREWTAEKLKEVESNG